MRLIKNTTELIGIKDQNIIISLVFETDTHNDKLPAVMSWDEFGFKKGELAFVETKLITILDNHRQTTIRNYFLKYPLKIRQKVRFITMDMSGSYMLLDCSLAFN